MQQFPLSPSLAVWLVGKVLQQHREEYCCPIFPPPPFLLLSSLLSFLFFLHFNVFRICHVTSSIRKPVSLLHHLQKLVSCKLHGSEREENCGPCSRWSCGGHVRGRMWIRSTNFEAMAEGWLTHTGDSIVSEQASGAGSKRYSRSRPSVCVQIVGYNRSRSERLPFQPVTLGHFHTPRANSRDREIVRAQTERKGKWSKGRRRRNTPPTSRRSVVTRRALECSVKVVRDRALNQMLFRCVLTHGRLE